ncbi:MAG: GNAT family N-acetyltransferase [Elusimicrobiota bacterium]|nr:GNAT family N-acetyltransferase [Elusimicrobiota bacterium]
MRLPPGLDGLLEPARFAVGLARRQELHLLEGEGRAGGKPLTALCAGPADLVDALLKRAFAPGARRRSLGTVPLWETCAALSRRAPGADLVLRFVRRSFEPLPRGPVVARLPAWVRMDIDLQSPLCAERGKDKRNRNRRTTAAGAFTTTLGRSEAEFAEFYDRFHLPLVTTRHGEGASVQSRAEVLAGLRGGQLRLIQVRGGGELVAGGTVELDGDQAHFWQMGVRDGDPELLRLGAADAVYHFMLALCRENGVRVLNLGHCRPFARDGVFDYKCLLGAYAAARRDARRGSLDLAAPGLTPAAADFLADNPLIALEPGGRLSLRAFARDAEQAAARAEECRRRYCFMDTLGLRVFILAPGGPRETQA